MALELGADDVPALIEEPQETEQAANHAGYLFFSSVEEFKTCARDYSLVEAYSPGRISMQHHYI